MAEPDKYVRDAKSWLAMGVGGAIGFGVSKGALRLGARIRDMLKKWAMTDPADADNVQNAGIAGAMVIYLSLLGYGLHKSGIAGDFIVGFSIGGLVDEFLALGV